MDTGEAKTTFCSCADHRDSSTTASGWLCGRNYHNLAARPSTSGWWNESQHQECSTPTAYCTCTLFPSPSGCGGWHGRNRTTRAILPPAGLLPSCNHGVQKRGSQKGSGGTGCFQAWGPCANVPQDLWGKNATSNFISSNVSSSPSLAVKVPLI